MVAYSFNKRFVAPILDGTKIGTIRKQRKRHARAAEWVQLYTGMRTKYCARIGSGVCQSARPIILSLDDAGVFYRDAMESIRDADDLDAFAVADGFADWDHLDAFWRVSHPGVAVFEGTHIVWGYTFAPAETC